MKSISVTPSINNDDDDEEEERDTVCVFIDIVAV